MKIPFNRPYLNEGEIRCAIAALTSGKVSGNGDFGLAAEKALEDIVSCQRALLTTSCTHALEMAATLLEVEPGDEIILPSYTFVSTANAFVSYGAIPVFCDIRSDTLNMDEALVEGLISEKTKAILPVHYGGVACEMDTIMEISRRRGIPVVEDNAHGLFGGYRGQALGSIGDFATLSFHETKNISCGEGGALLINSQSYVERAEIIREKGTDRSKFFRGEIDKYNWVDRGSSYVLSDILAAVLTHQLDDQSEIQRKRENLWYHYAEALAGLSDRHGIRLPQVPNECDSAWHLFHLILPSEQDRDRFIDHMKEVGISAVFHYLPLDRSPMGRRLGKNPDSCPVTADLASRLVRLPFFTGLTESDQERVIERVLEFQAG